MRRDAGEGVLRVAGGLDALEQCEACREQAATPQLFADAGRHGAEVLADDDRAGAMRLERHDLEQLVRVGSDVGAPRRILAGRNPPQPEEAEHVVDPQPTGVPQLGVDRVDERAIRRLP